jgi:6-pyruvoyltetrahydropterin/6-carboxytetrahydropterin synthase
VPDRHRPPQPMPATRRRDDAEDLHREICTVNSPGDRPSEPPLRLTRLVRFWISPCSDGSEMPRASGFGGVPAPSGIPTYLEIAVTVEGCPDPQSGYLIGIQHLDRAVRDRVVPWLASQLQHQVADGQPPLEPSALLPEIARRLAGGVPVPIREVSLRLTPFHELSLQIDPLCTDPDAMPASTPLLRQRFEFSASHRLHCPELSDEENRQIFGKCNHPNGHGHNYRLEVAVELPRTGGDGISHRLEAIVGREVIDRFDHRHLNLDTEEFRDRNPSVEGIAEVCHGLLASPVAAIGGILREVTVWETEKTSCTYPAPPPR